MEWEVVIGLETHVQLSTKSKIFSGASAASAQSRTLMHARSTLPSPAASGAQPRSRRKAIRLRLGHQR